MYLWCQLLWANKSPPPTATNRRSRAPSPCSPRSTAFPNTTRKACCIRRQPLPPRSLPLATSNSNSNRKRTRPPTYAPRRPSISRPPLKSKPRRRSAFSRSNNSSKPIMCKLFSNSNSNSNSNNSRDNSLRSSHRVIAAEMVSPC